MIDTKRLQVILNEMADWEQGVFEKEFSDLNWYKGKQTKHVKEAEQKRNESQRGPSSAWYFLPVIPILIIVCCCCSDEPGAKSDLRQDQILRP